MTRREIFYVAWREISNISFPKFAWNKTARKWWGWWKNNTSFTYGHPGEETTIRKWRKHSAWRWKNYTSWTHRHPGLKTTPGKWRKNSSRDKTAGNGSKTKRTGTSRANR